MRCRNRDEKCEACHGEGKFYVNQCPALYVDAWVWEAFWFARQAKEFGMWPVDGGILSQSRWAIDAFREIWQAEAAY